MLSGAKHTKSVAVRFRTGYKIVAASGSRSKHPCTKRHIDFLAAYIIPEGLWYILPVQAFSPHVSAWFFPRGLGRYERYREAWRLLGG